MATELQAPPESDAASEASEVPESPPLPLPELLPLAPELPPPLAAPELLAPLLPPELPEELPPPSSVADPELLPPPPSCPGVPPPAELLLHAARTPPRANTDRRPTMRMWSLPLWCRGEPAPCLTP